MRNEELALFGVNYALHYVGRWYKWGGDDPSGFDCSGIACEMCSATGRIARGADFSAAALKGMFPPASEPGPGMLAFWSAPGRPVSHVEIVAVVIEGVPYSVGASGGGSTTRTEADAIRQNAWIKVRPVLGRTGFLGYVDPFQTP